MLKSLRTFIISLLAMAFILGLAFYAIHTRPEDSAVISGRAFDNLVWIALALAGRSALSKFALRGQKGDSDNGKTPA